MYVMHSFFNHSTLLRSLAVAFCFVLISHSWLFAQESSPQTTAEVKQEEEPTQENRFKELANHFEEQAVFLDKLRTLASDEVIKKQREEIAELKTLLLSQTKDIDILEKKDIREVSADQIELLETPLAQKEMEIERAKEKSAAGLAECTEMLEAAKKKDELWQSAFKDLSENGAPPEVQQRVKKAAAEVEKLQKVVKKHFNELILIQSDIAELSTLVTKSISKISQIKSKYRATLFVSDEAPLYSPRFWQKIHKVAFHDFSVIIATEKENLHAYLAASRNRVTLHIVLVVLLGWVILRLKNTSFVQMSFPKLYDNPILMFVTSSLLLTFVLHPDLTPGLEAGVSILLVFPLVLFFQDLLGKKYSLITCGLGALFLLDRLRGCFGELNSISLLILLSELLGAILLAQAYIHSSRREQISSETSTKASGEALLQFIASLITLICILSAGLLCFGYYRLTLFLSGNLFNSVFLALLLYAAYRLGSGFLSSLLHTKLVDPLRFVAKYQPELRLAINRLLAFLFIVIWTIQVLKNLDIYRHTTSIVQGILRGGVEVGDFSLTLGGILSFCLILYLGNKLSKLVLLVLAEDVYKRSSLNPGLCSTIDTAVHWTLLSLSVLLAVAALGINFQNLALIAGALSVGIGFGLQNIVNNFVSGIILLIERPVKVGDLILLDGTLGNVTRIGMRSSTVRQLDDAEIIIPNSRLITENLVNWTFSNRRARLSLPIGVAYGTDVVQCMQILRDAVTALPFVLDTPGVHVLFLEFADSSLNFEVRAWIRNVEQRPVQHSEALVAISKALEVNGIEIPFPQRDVHIHQS